MATAVVDRPISALNEIPASPHRRRRRRRRASVVEIIDVDLPDEATRVPNGPPPPQEGTGTLSQDVISIVDSDDDDLHLPPPVAPGSNRVRTRPPAGQRHRLFSPPPPPQDHTIPDVPRVPQRYSGHTSLPMRLHPPPFPSPPIRARDQPFEFEANIPPAAAPVAGPSNGNHNRNRRAAVSPPELGAAPPSHHTPTMGLGGGLISFNRAQSNIQRRDHLRQQANDRGVVGRASSAMRRFYTAIIGHDDDNEDFRSHHDDYPALQMLLAHDLGLVPAGDNDDDGFGHPARPYAWQEILSRRRGAGRVRNQEEDYKPEFTHPGKPESGFTFDFAPPSSTEASSSDAKGKAVTAPVIIDLEADVETDIPSMASSSSPSGPPSLQTLLVCAKCLDPLVLGAGLVGEEVRARKVWALRCGHLIDGKCLDLVGVPDAGHVDVGKGNDAETGKARAVDPKGKGKAKAVEELPSSPEVNPIRSRLRSRVNGHLSTSSSSPAPSSSRSARALAASGQTHLGKRKRTSTSLKNTTEAKYEWECPVVGCKRVHVSVKMEGAWLPEPDTPIPAGKGKSKWSLALSHPEVTGGRGAVAVYV